MSIKLPIDLYSPDQLSTVMLELHHYISALRNANAQAKTGHDKSTAQRPQLSVMLQEVLRGSKVSNDSITACESLLGQLEKIRSSAPIARLTLADLPGSELKKRLTTWFREQIHPELLLTFSVRSDIGGGLILQAGPHLYDMSFRKQILGNKQRLGEIFSKGAL